jgi:2-dehydro-3-deoxyphosphogluconate aldolase/(4S)-4-hydroxy-2-oxoglutarate aldolase
MHALQDILRPLVEPGIIAIVRSAQPLDIRPLTEALINGGITAVEITLTTPGALDALPEARNVAGPRAVVGAGTVLHAVQGSAALAAGAQFIVSPLCRTELVPLAHAAARPVMLGAYTPTEAQTAHEAGADFVKLFPADGLGPGYLKSIRGPLPHLRLVPTGGVDLHTLADFVQAGCPAVGVGSCLVSAAILRDRSWSELTRLATAFVAAIQRAKSGLPAS